jgi:hypothetical protein
MVEKRVSDPRAEAESFVASLHAEYEIWYAKSVRRMYVSYYALQLTVLFSGFSAALVAALADGQAFDGWAKAALILLPCVGSLAAACLHFFRIYDRWRLREDGRIAFAALAVRGRRELAAADTSAKCSKLHARLEAAMISLEQSQSSRFFGLSPADAVAVFQAPPKVGPDGQDV